ncbi:MAG TPA: electron transfer flavoprotein subunit beta/FixA family protein [Myxococcota bacterium]|nr:electron transfer flavoprotein subunit beta/FixA family protein [Myxococcota bacterium]
MNIVVAMKQVPDLVEDLVVDENGTTLDPDEVEYRLNEFDDHALEEGLLLKERVGGALTVVALDGDGVDKVLFTALAKGADRAVKIEGDPEEIEGNFALAAVFAQVVAELPCDLLLTGVQGCDDRDGHLGPLLAAMLKLPCASVVTEVDVSGGVVRFLKEYSGGVVGRFEADLPAVLGVQAARQSPRYVPVSKVRQVQKSATIETTEPDDEATGLSTVTWMAPPETGEGATMLDGVEELIELLESKGVLS